jgi:glyoxylase-like metal-dependent hydrolase (beta-lactamase superfamily II)
VTEVAADVWQLEGWPTHWFNVYLAGDVLIDGATRWAKGRVLRQLRGRPLRLMALTHCHPDHQGVAAAVCRRFGIPLACHVADVPAMTGTGPMLPDNRILRFGTRVWAGPSHPVARPLQEGDQVGEFRVVHTPGHTPGHVVYFRERDRVALAGDIVANWNFRRFRAELREPPWAFSWHPLRNRQAMQTLAELRPAVLLTGHGPPLHDPAALAAFAARRQVPPPSERQV